MDKEKKLGIVLGYFNIIINTIINFIYVPVLLHYVGKNEYGIFQLIGSLIAYLSLMDFGLNSAIVTFYTKFKANNQLIKMENLLAISLRAYCLITVVLMGVGSGLYLMLPLIFSNTLNPTELDIARQMFILLIVNIAVTITTLLCSAVINAHEKFIFYRGITAIQLIVQPIFVVIMLNFYRHIIVVAIVQTLLNIILAMVRIYYTLVVLKVKIIFHGYDMNIIKPLSRLAFTTFAVAIVDQIFFKTNQIIIGIINGPDEVAVYSIATLIYMGYMQISSAISGVFVPKITMMVALKEKIEKISNIFINVGNYQFFALSFVLSGFIVLGKEFILLWAGKDFLEAYFITLIILVPFTIDLIQNSGLCIMQAQNNYGFRAKIYILMGILNIVLSLWLCQSYSGIGCAFSTGFSMLIGNGIIMNIYYYKVVKINIVLFWEKIFCSLKTIIVFTLITYFINNWLVSYSIMIFAIKSFVWGIIFIIVVYLKCLTKSEQKKLLSMMRIK